MTRKGTLIRLLSLFLVFSFVLEPASFAAEEVARFDFFSKAKPDLGLPPSVASVEDFEEASGRRIYLVQDAHANPSGQINLAKTLESLFRKDPGIRRVFVEAGFGDNSLSFLRRYGTAGQRAELARPLLFSGELHGEEYLDLTSDHGFSIEGVEDLALYRKSVEDYRGVVRERERFSAYLGRIQAAIDALKPRIYNPVLLSLDALREKSRRGEISTVEYCGELERQATRLGAGVSAYPELEALGGLRAREAAIDMKKAALEQAAALRMLPPDAQKELLDLAAKNAPSRFSSAEHGGEKAFYALFEEKLGSRASSFPELAVYLAYRRDARKIDPRRVLDETAAIEKELFGLAASDENERALTRAQDAAYLLGKLFSLAMTPEDYARYKDLTKGFGIEELTGFLNRRFLDAGSGFDRAVFLEDGYEETVARAEAFYESTFARDAHFVKEVLARMGEEKSAILITGGFHAPNLKSLIRGRGLSFVSIVPQVLRETDLARYEKILLSQRNLLAKGLPTPLPAASTDRTLTAAAQWMMAGSSERPGTVLGRLAETASRQGLFDETAYRDAPWAIFRRDGARLSSGAPNPAVSSGRTRSLEIDYRPPTVPDLRTFVGKYPALVTVSLAAAWVAGMVLPFFGVHPSIPTALSFLSAAYFYYAFMRGSRERVDLTGFYETMMYFDALRLWRPSPSSSAAETGFSAGPESVGRRDGARLTGNIPEDFDYGIPKAPDIRTTAAKYPEAVTAALGGSFIFGSLLFLTAVNPAIPLMLTGMPLLYLFYIYISAKLGEIDRVELQAHFREFRRRYWKSEQIVYDPEHGRKAGARLTAARTRQIVASINSLTQSPDEKGLGRVAGEFLPELRMISYATGPADQRRLAQSIVYLASVFPGRTRDFIQTVRDFPPFEYSLGRDRFDDEAVDPDGRQFAWVPGFRAIVRIWDAFSGTVRDYVGVSGSHYKSIIFSPDGKFLALSADRGRSQLDLEVIDTENLTLRHEAKDVSLWSASVVDFSPDGRFAAYVALSRKTADASRGFARYTNDSVVVVDLQTGQAFRRWDLPAGVQSAARGEGRATALAFSGDGRRLAVGVTGSGVAIWDLEANRRIFLNSIEPDARTEALAFSPIGNTIATLEKRKSYSLGIVDAVRDRVVQTVKLPRFQVPGEDPQVLARHLLKFVDDGRVLALRSGETLFFFGPDGKKTHNFPAVLPRALNVNAAGTRVTAHAIMEKSPNTNPYKLVVWGRHSLDDFPTNAPTVHELTGLFESVLDERPAEFRGILSTLPVSDFLEAFRLYAEETPLGALYLRPPGFGPDGPSAIVSRRAQLLQMPSRRLRDAILEFADRSAPDTDPDMVMRRAFAHALAGGIGYDQGSDVISFADFYRRSGVEEFAYQDFFYPEGTIDAEAFRATPYAQPPLFRFFYELSAAVWADAFAHLAAADAFGDDAYEALEKIISRPNPRFPTKGAAAPVARHLVESFFDYQEGYPAGRAMTDFEVRTLKNFVANMKAWRSRSRENSGARLATAADLVARAQALAADTSEGGRAALSDALESIFALLENPGTDEALRRELLSPVNVRMISALDRALDDWRLEGYEILRTDSTPDPDSGYDVSVEIRKNGQLVPGVSHPVDVQMRVEPLFKTVYIRQFYPEFAQDKRGRGRALLRRLLDRHPGYDVIVYSDSPSFQKSFGRMLDMNPLTYLNRFRTGDRRFEEVRAAGLESAAAAPRASDAARGRVKTYWSLSNIHGKTQSGAASLHDVGGIAPQDETAPAGAGARLADFSRAFQMIQNFRSGLDRAAPADFEAGFRAADDEAPVWRDSVDPDDRDETPDGDGFLDFVLPENVDQAERYNGRFVSKLAQLELELERASSISSRPFDPAVRERIMALAALVFDMERFILKHLDIFDKDVDGAGAFKDIYLPVLKARTLEWAASDPATLRVVQKMAAELFAQEGYEYLAGKFEPAAEVVYEPYRARLQSVLLQMRDAGEPAAERLAEWAAELASIRQGLIKAKIFQGAAYSYVLSARGLLAQSVNALRHRAGARLADPSEARSKYLEAVETYYIKFLASYPQGQLGMTPEEMSRSIELYMRVRLAGLAYVRALFNVGAIPDLIASAIADELRGAGLSGHRLDMELMKIGRDIEDLPIGARLAVKQPIDPKDIVAVLFEYRTSPLASELLPREIRGALKTEENPRKRAVLKAMLARRIETRPVHGDFVFNDRTGSAIVMVGDRKAGKSLMTSMFLGVRPGEAAVPAGEWKYGHSDDVIAVRYKNESWVARQSRNAATLIFRNEDNSDYTQVPVASADAEGLPVIVPVGKVLELRPEGGEGAAVPDWWRSPDVFVEVKFTHENRIRVLEQMVSRLKREFGEPANTSPAGDGARLSAFFAGAARARGAASQGARIALLLGDRPSIFRLEFDGRRLVAHGEGRTVTVDDVRAVKGDRAVEISAQDALRLLGEASASVATGLRTTGYADSSKPVRVTIDLDAIANRDFPLNVRQLAMKLLTLRLDPVFSNVSFAFHAGDPALLDRARAEWSRQADPGDAEGVAGQIRRNGRAGRAERAAAALSAMTAELFDGTGKKEAVEVGLTSDRDALIRGAGREGLHLPMRRLADGEVSSFAEIDLAVAFGRTDISSGLPDGLASAYRTVAHLSEADYSAHQTALLRVIRGLGLTGFEDPGRILSLIELKPLMAAFGASLAFHKMMVRQFAQSA